MTQTSMIAKFGAALDVGGEVAGIDIGDAGDEGRTQKWRQALVPWLAGFTRQHRSGVRNSRMVGGKGGSGFRGKSRHKARVT